MRNVLLCVVLLVIVLSVAPSLAQKATSGKGPEVTAAAQRAPAPRSSLLDLLKAGGPIGHTILLLSVVAVALVVDYSVSIRAQTLMPRGLADRVRQQLQAGQVAEALRECQAQPNALASVLQAGLSELDGGWTMVEKAMEDAVAEQSARFSRRIDYLTVIGNIAPMLGLLGTVTGMIEAFQTVAETQGVARAADLAKGIYEALVTTVEGLVVAIPSLGLYAFFRNRVDQLISEVAYAAQHALLPLRRAKLAQARGAAKPPPFDGSGT